MWPQWPPIFLTRATGISRLLGAAKLQTAQDADDPHYAAVIIFKKCIWSRVNLTPTILCIVCGHRNARKRSSDSSQPAGDVYEAPNWTGQEQPQYDVIQLGDTQHYDSDADHYVPLNPQTQGLEPEYDAISRPQADRPNDAPIYANVM